MQGLSTTTVSVLHGLFEKRATVQGQGGLLTGQDPASYYPSDPLRLWIIQLGIIIMMAQLLGLFLGKIRQPRVIAEILGGILLGPTAFGRIPGFTDHIFPSSSISYLTLTADIGLCLFLFIIGLDIDSTIIRRNARLSIVVSLSGILLPFAIGCGISVALYHHFINSSINFNYFMLFIGVSFSITAFPVLCRILTALKLLDTTVGLIVLSAGVANDVVAWSLLALAVAFVNATSGLTALWTFLLCVGYTLILLFPVKYALLWLARKTGSTVHGPSFFYMTVVMLVLWGSAFFTDIIGVNAIFGAFVVGVIVPREGGISISFVEKLEDMVQIIFIPLYFTISGLNTNLGLINTGTAWGFVFAIAVLDFTGKFTGCSLSSRLLGFSWREATTVGSLMSCKGLVELIVLNTGLSAGILTQQVFSMFVFEALLLTFMTTPLVNLIYPPKYRTYGLGAGIARMAADDNEREKSIDGSDESGAEENQCWRRRFAVVLDGFTHLPGIMALTKLITPSTLDDNNDDGKLSLTRTPMSISLNALRLIELTERTSTIMKSAITETLIGTDPVVGVFKMFGEQSDTPVSASLSVVSQDEWAHAVAEHAERNGSQMVLMPWIPPSLTSSSSSSTAATEHSHSVAKQEPNPFDTFFGGGGGGGSGGGAGSFKDNSAATLSSQFVRGVFRHCKTDVALFVDLGDNAGTNGPQHVLFPFFGGADDRLGLELVVQLCATNTRVSATVVRVRRRGTEQQQDGVVAKPEAAVVDERTTTDAGSPAATSVAFTNTVYGKPDTAFMLQSETADDLAWSRYATPPAPNKEESNAQPHQPQQQMRSALSRIEFSDMPGTHPLPLHALVQRAKQLREAHRRVLVVVGRSKQFAGSASAESDARRQEVKQLAGCTSSSGNEWTAVTMVRNTVGDVGAAFVVAAAAASAAAAAGGGGGTGGGPSGARYGGVVVVQRGSSEEGAGEV